MSSEQNNIGMPKALSAQLEDGTAKSLLDGQAAQKLKDDVTDPVLVADEGLDADGSPKNYKNLSINLILNIHGKVQVQNPNQAYGTNPKLPSIGSVPGVPKDMSTSQQQQQQQQDLSPKYLPYQRNQYFNHHLRSVSSIDNKLAATSFTDSPQQTQQRTLVGPYGDNIAYQQPPGVAEAAHLVNLQQTTGSNASLVQSQYGQNVALGYGHLVQPGNQPMYPSHAATNLVPQQMISGGNQMHQLLYNPLHHQSHLALDLDPLHESKRGRRFRRRYNQIVRKYNCSYPGCVKSYGSLNHLNTHIVTKKHGHRKSKADFQHNQLSEDGTSNNTQQGPYDASNYPSHLQQHSPSDYTQGNYWYGYNPQVRSNQQVAAPQQQMEVHANTVAPPGSIPAPTYMYYQQGYPQHIPPPISQQRPPMGWPQQTSYPYTQMQGLTLQQSYQQTAQSTQTSSILQQHQVQHDPGQHSDPQMKSALESSTGTSPPLKR